MKGTILKIVLGILLSAQFLQAQEEFSTGLLFDETAFEEAVEMIPAFSNDGRRAADLPRKFSLRAFTPYPKNQGSINSCIGWAMGYAALTTQKAYREGQTDRKKISDNAHSALFIYNQVKEGSCMSGAYIHKAAEFLKSSGTCFHNEFDFPYTDCSRDPESELVEKSQEFAVKDFVGLFTKGTAPKTKVMRTKRSIAEGKPVVLGMRIRESLKHLNSKNPTWKPKGETDKNLGGHALCVVGFNDSLGVFEIMNSWGIAWGDAGFFRMSYKDFTEHAFQGVQLVLPDLLLSESEKQRIQMRKETYLAQLDQARKKRQLATSNKAKAIQIKNLADNAKIQTTDADKQDKADALLEQAQALLLDAKQEDEQAQQTEIQALKQISVAQLETAALAGDFSIQMPVTDEFGTLVKDENDQFMFDQLPVELIGGIYELGKKDWEEGDQFQVLASQIKQDSYVYLFSLDGNNKAEIHWPPNQKFEEHLRGYELKGKGAGALVTHSGAEILIPGKDRVLVRENLLDDHICVLYSNEKIEDFQDRIVRMRDECEGDFQSRLQTAFNDLLIPSEDVSFETDRMFCGVEQINSGIAIPVILKIINQ